jgi:ATP-dependent helicase/nuclease subunit B
VSFEQLARDVLEETGGAAVPEITPLGRQMILGHLLRRHESDMRFFASTARQIGLAAELEATFSEMERCGCDGEHLKELLESLQQAEPADVERRSLLAKIHDLHLLYTAYTAYLGSDRLDPHRRVMQVLESMQRCRLFQDAVVYVDGFAKITQHERRMLTGMAGICRRIEIVLLAEPVEPMPGRPPAAPNELDLFHRTQRTYRELWECFTEAGIGIESPRLLEQVHRFRNPVLARIESELFPSSSHAGRLTSAAQPEQNAPCESGIVTLTETPDRRTEVDAAARWIQGMMRQGLRLRDIGVLVRDLAPYHELIDASFREHGIPYFIDRRRGAAHHPLLQTVRSALLIAVQHWPHDAVMSLVKSGLVDLSSNEADKLENYVLLHRIHGSAWEVRDDWAYRSNGVRSAEDSDAAEPEDTERVELERINTLRRRVVQPLRPLLKALGGARELMVRQMVVELFEMLERYGVRRRLAEWIESAAADAEHEQQAEHEQVWRRLVELLDQLVDLLGDEQVTPAQFLEILDTALEQFDLALTPPTLDEVLVGQVDRTRTPQVRAVVLLGINVGEFPRIPREDSIFSDAERRSLLEWDLDLDPDSQRQLLDENLLGYIALTRASEHLCLTRSVSDDAGRPLGPSPLWRRVQALLPDAPVETIDRRPAPTTRHVATPRQLITSAMKWASNRDEVGGMKDEGDRSAWAALYQWLATDGVRQEPVANLLHRAWPALRYENHAMLSPEVASRLFSSPLHASVTRIETFATCPFRHFVQYGLKLSERDDQDITPLDLGNACHQILERMVRGMLEQRREWKDLPPEVSQRIIRECAAEVAKDLRGELMLSTARSRYLLDRVEQTIGQVVEAQRAAAERGRFRPAYAELGFGIEGAMLPPHMIATPAGAEVRLYGKIDRVDVIDEEGACAVIDYKLRGNTLSLERVYHGLALQLLTYLLVLKAQGERLAGRPLNPVAGFYVQMLRRLERVSHPDDQSLDPEAPEFHLQTKPRGIFDGRFLAALDGECASGRRDVVSAMIKKDGTFAKGGDAATAEEFAALLRHVEQKIGQLADQILAGHVGIDPYRMKQLTPCPSCAYRSVCRFDSTMNRYHHLESMKREQVLEKLAEEA